MVSVAQMKFIAKSPQQAIFRHAPGEFKPTYYCWSPTAVDALSFSGLALWFVRSLHIRLLSMHVTAALSQSGNVAKYLLPVSDTSCAVTYRFMLALRILFDVSRRMIVFV